VLSWPDSVQVGDNTMNSRLSLLEGLFEVIKGHLKILCTLHYVQV